MSAARTLLLALLVALAPSARGAGAAVQIDRVEAMRYALLVEPAAGSGVRELQAVLRDRYGFQVLVVAGAEARRGAIVELMSEVGGLVRPFDELVVLVGLPLLQDAYAAKTGAGLGLSYVPVDGERESPWTLLPMHEVIDWLAKLPTGAALYVHPGCGGAFSASEDELLHRLSRGKRPGPVNVLLTCDQRRETALGTVSIEPKVWRADELAAAMAGVLGEAAGPESGSLGSIDLAHRLAARIDSLRLEVRVYPEGAGEVRFQPTGTEAGYRKRYEQAISYDAAKQVMVEFAGAAGEHLALVGGLIELLGDAAVDARAAAPGARPDERGALETRRAAIDLLLRNGSEPARAALAATVTRAADSAVVRSYAVSALSRLPELTARERAALRRALGDGDAAVREAAVLGLSVAKDVDAASSYRRLVRADPSLGVRVASLQALSALARAEDRDFFAAQLDNAAPELRREAASALAGLGPSSSASAKLLERLAGDADEQVRQRAAYALGRTFDDAARGSVTAGLVAALVSGSEPVARAAASSLGRLAGRDAERALMEALAGRTAEGVRVASAEALGQMRSAAAVQVLERIADAECTRAAEKTAEQLRPELGVTRACIEPAAVRRAAVSALAAIGGERVAAFLFRKLEDPDAYVRREAVRALSTESSKDPAYLPVDVAQQSAQTRAFTFRNVADTADPRGLELLLGGLSDESRAARAEAVSALSKLTDEAAIDRVAEVLRGGDILGRQSAATVLGRVPTEAPAVLEALAAGARDDSSAVRAESVRSLGLRRDARARETLIAALEDPAAEVRAAAAESLGWMRDDPEVRRRLELRAKADPAAEVRAAAIAAITGGDASVKR